MRTSLAALLGIVLVGCSGLASPSPAATGTGHPPSVAPSASVVATEPAPIASPPPEPNVGALTWGEPVTMEGRSLDPESAFDGAPGMFVTVANTDIWFSADGTHWGAVDSGVEGAEYLTLNDVVIGPKGIVAVGDQGIIAADNSTIGFNAVVLLSQDGRTWERIADSAFKDGQMQMAGATRQGFVVFGQDFSGHAAIWTSPDGREWLRATNETGLKVAAGVRLLIPADGDLAAVVGPPGNVNQPASEYEIWHTQGRAEWERVGRLVEGDRGRLVGAAGGGRWIVAGSTRTWTSTDGLNWSVGSTPHVASGSSITDVAAYAGGYIAVGDSGSRPDETCGGNLPWVGHTWTSADGQAWDEHLRFERGAVSRLVRLEGSVIGLGRSVTRGGELTGVAWTSALPGSLAGPVPTPVPTPSPTPARSSDGCGS
jgi:hypothetical protein